MAVATAVLAVGMAAACSGGTSGDKASPTTGTATTAADLATPPNASTSPTDPIAAEIAAGKYPPCKLTVGEPQSLVVRSVSAAGNVDLRCITGDSTASDHTGAGTTNCNPTDKQSPVVYYWGNQNPGGDQTIYAAKAGGVVVIVPNETAKFFFTVGGGLASVLLAVGSC